MAKRTTATITTTTAGRMEVGIVPLENSDIPTVILNDSGNLPSNYSVTTEDGLNIYIGANILGSAVSYADLYRNYSGMLYGERSYCAISYTAGTKQLCCDSGGCGVIGLRCSYKEASE